MFQDKVAMSRNGTSTTLSTIFVGGAEIGELDAPSEIHVSLYEFKDRIRISWSPVKHAASYVLERAVVTDLNSITNENGVWEIDESEYEVLEHSNYITSTSYTDTIIKDDIGDALNCENEKYGYFYFYRVRAENTRLGYKESEYCESGYYGALLPPPSDTKATAGEAEDYIKVTWKRSLGANRYDVYRSENEDGSNPVKVTTVTGNVTEYKDTTVSSSGGKNLFYTVRSISAETGEQSVPSPVALGYTLVPGAPSAVKEVRVKEGHGDNAQSIKIEWDSISSSAGEEIIYTVYRSSSESSTMKWLGEQKSPYTDQKDLKPNVYYYYYVQTSKKEEAKEGEEATVLKGPMSKSGPEDEKPAEGFILSAPSSVEVTKDKDKNTISFTPVIGDKNFPNNPRNYENEYEYIVYGDNSQGGSFSAEVRRTSEPNFAEGKYSLKVDSYDFYKVGVEFNGEKSALTDVCAPAPFAAENVYVTRAAMVEDYSKYVPASDTATIEPGTNSNGVHAVKITWDAPDGGASSYNVYRSDKRQSGFRKITDKPTSDCYYIDRNESAKVGTVYYYRVISLNSLGQGVNKSEIDEPEVENNLIKTTDNGKPYGRGWGWGAISTWRYIQEMCKTINNSHKRSNSLRPGSSLSAKMNNDRLNGLVCGTWTYEFDFGSMYATVHYERYADYYIDEKNKALGAYFLLTGNTDTKADMSQNGNMYKSVDCYGMYPGNVSYDHIEVKGGDSGGGYYVLVREGIDNSTGGCSRNVSYLAGK